jgi:hypothetical protein
MLFSTVPPPAAAAGAPAGWSVFRFYATTDADIISIENVRIDMLPGYSPLFQVAPPFGRNTEPPSPAFIAINRALEVDSWISTPGPTTLTGADMPGDGTGAWSDETDDGPQTDFPFATLTLPPRVHNDAWGSYFKFRGRFALAGPGGPEYFPFLLGDWDQTIAPEPSGGILCAGGMAALALSRRWRTAKRSVPR